jgi:hypothetical protein
MRVNACTHHNGEAAARGELGTQAGESGCGAAETRDTSRDAPPNARAAKSPTAPPKMPMKPDEGGGLGMGQNRDGGDRSGNGNGNGKGKPRRPPCQALASTHTQCWHSTTAPVVHTTSAAKHTCIQNKNRRRWGGGAHTRWLPRRATGARGASPIITLGVSHFGSPRPPRNRQPGASEQRHACAVHVGRPPPSGGHPQRGTQPRPSVTRSRQATPAALCGDTSCHSPTNQIHR